MNDTWEVLVGDYLSREERTAKFGGSTMGGIQPSASSPNIFVYSDPAKGHQNGYIFDGWTEDKSTFLYTGEGRHGDQRMIAGNLALLQHKEKGRALRVFVADGKIPGRQAKRQRYIGRFEIDDAKPEVRDRAPDLDGMIRSVIIFRLKPIGHTIARKEDRSETGDVAKSTESELVDLEDSNTDEFDQPSQPGGIALKRETQLVERYKQFLGPPGAELRRWKVRPSGTLLTLFTDIYDSAKHELYEAKASSTRADIRLAIGQLLDYRRWITPPPRKTTILVPSRPATDLVELLRDLNIGLIYEEAPGQFVDALPRT